MHLYYLISILLNTEILAGLAMPARASTFNCLETDLNDDTLSDADALAGIVKPAGPFGSLFPNSLLSLGQFQGFIYPVGFIYCLCIPLYDH